MHDRPADDGPPGIASVLVTEQMYNNQSPSTAIPITRPGQVPAYTLNDVRAYFETHPFIAGHVVPGTTVMLTTLEFLTGKDAAKAIHKSTLKYSGVADDAVVCYLEFAGTFDLTSFYDDLTHIGPPTWQKPGAPPPLVTPFTIPKDPYAYRSQAVINATTGRVTRFRYRERSHPLPN